MSAHTETPSPLDAVMAAHRAYNATWAARHRKYAELARVRRELEELEAKLNADRDAYVTAQAAYSASLSGKADVKVGEWLPGLSPRGAAWKVEQIHDNGSIVARTDFGKRQTIPAERVGRMLELRDARRLALSK